jgi:hypothetical protein
VLEIVGVDRMFQIHSTIEQAGVQAPGATYA